MREVDNHRSLSTLDFTLINRNSEQLFVSELKCWVQYEDYAFLKLKNTAQIERIKKETKAFKRFVQLAKEPNALKVDLLKGSRREEIKIHGSILIWGSVSPEGYDAVKKEYGFAEVLSVESMLNDLRTWRPAEWAAQVQLLRKWCNELFDFLVWNEEGTASASR